MKMIYMFLFLTPTIAFGDAYWSCQGFESLDSGSPDFGYVLEDVSSLQDAIKAAKRKSLYDHGHETDYIIQCQKYVKAESLLFSSIH
jgi:hypothetical protein